MPRSGSGPARSRRPGDAGGAGGGGGEGKGEGDGSAVGGGSSGSAPGSGSGSESSPPRFTDAQLDMMLYEWDEGAHPVMEYHVRSDPDGEVPDAGGAGAAGAAGGDGGDVVDVAEVDVNSTAAVDRYAPGRAARPVRLDLDTSSAAHVIEFYAPWCPHCQKFKYKYVDMAREVERRSIGTTVYFHAASCELYRDLCRTYGLTGFPVVLGYPIGSDPAEYGIELNAVDLPSLTADGLGERLGLELAREAKSFWTSSYSDSDEQRRHVERIERAARDAAELKRSWHEFRPNTLNDRYHNAALSLAFVLTEGVYDRYGELDDRRSSVLSDLIDALDWTLPPSWDVRTKLVRELRNEFETAATKGRDDLVDLVRTVQVAHEDDMGEEAADRLWGHVDVPKPNKARLRRKKEVTGLGGDVPDAKDTTPPPIDYIRRRNRWWTESCTHGRRGAGFTCGLWDLFHIVTVGASMPDHQLYGFHRGYPTSPRSVGRVIRDVVSNFFPCDVCRWNFVDMYDACGRGHCRRLSSCAPAALGTGMGGTGRGDDAGRETALWLWEVHNAINVRLMKEAAEGESRVVTAEERTAGRWPTSRMCPECWTDERMERYDRDVVYDFLRMWYWPFEDGVRRDASFDSVLNRRVREVRDGYAPALGGGGGRRAMLILAAGIVAAAVLGAALLGWGTTKRRMRPGNGRRRFVDSRYGGAAAGRAGNGVQFRRR